MVKQNMICLTIDVLYYSLSKISIENQIVINLFINKFI